MCTRSDFSIRHGGDIVQATETAKHLQSIGIDVVIASRISEIPENVDILHLFNLTRVADTLAFASYGIENSIPYVVSPIWHSLEDMSRFYSYRYKTKIFNIRWYLALKEWLYYRDDMIFLLKSTLNWHGSVRTVINNARLLLPNSPEEMKAIEDQMGVSQEFRVVPNGINISGNCKKKRKNLILVPGRIEPRKNQLAVMTAFTESEVYKEGYEIQFVGAANNAHKKYFEEFSKLVSQHENAHYLGKVEFDCLQSLMKESRVVVLASFFETTGLVALEGISNGCQAVMTSRSYNNYYFGDFVHYCDPYVIESIRLAIDSAALSPIDLRSYDLRRYTWHRASEETYAAYRLVLE